MYSERIGREDSQLLNQLGDVENSAGNFRIAIDLLKRSLELKEQMGTYSHLIHSLVKMGDIVTAEQLSRQADSFNKAQSGKGNAEGKNYYMSLLQNDHSYGG